ncbi:hypothetical protein [Streptomyces sp. NPDC007205]|uniref:hypothetical protein n=1 Tax=Streptomyces sp. NPDC007205 TaxID=3154316 RepID=UPI0033DE332A
MALEKQEGEAGDAQEEDGSRLWLSKGQLQAIHMSLCDKPADQQSLTIGTDINS